MVREWAKDRMRPALWINRGGQITVQALNRHAHGPHGFLGLVHNLRRPHLLPFIQFCQFALDFGFDGFGGVFVVEDGFEFELFAAQGGHGGGVVQCEVSLLQDGVAGQDYVFAGGWVYYRVGRQQLCV